VSDPPKIAIQVIRKISAGFHDFLRTEYGMKWIENRREKLKDFSGMLSEENLRKLSEADFIKVMSNFGQTDCGQIRNIQKVKLFELLRRFWMEF